MGTISTSTNGTSLFYSQYPSLNDVLRQSGAQNVSRDSHTLVTMGVDKEYICGHCLRYRGGSFEAFL